MGGPGCWGHSGKKKKIKITKKLEKARMKGAGAGGCKDIWGGSRGFQGRSREGPEVLGGKTAKGTSKAEKYSGIIWLAYYTATSRILCRRF